MIRQVTADGAEPLLILDPENVATDDEIRSVCPEPIELRRVGDWFSLRTTWEEFGRDRLPSESRLVVVVNDPATQRSVDLPFDVQQQSSVATIRVPAPDELRAPFLSLTDEESDVAAERITAAGLDAANAVLTAAAHLPPLRVISGADQLRAVLRLAEYGALDSVVTLAETLLTDPLARSVLAEELPYSTLAKAWESWVADGTSSPWAEHIEACRAELVHLFTTGALAPIRADVASLPGWVKIGVRGASPFERTVALLDERPDSATTFDDWVRVAQWWGEVRGSLADVNPADRALSARAWSAWEELNEQFLPWLRSQYGLQLSRTWVNGPISLDKVQPFLQTRRSRSARLMLIVLDGMGFAQWSAIRDSAKLRVLSSAGTLAMLPTLTEVSRQAIAAGTRPTQFADSLRATHKEAKHWATAWGDVASTRWTWIRGATVDELDAIDVGSVEVLGVVLGITDELMHSAEQLGDIGLRSGVRTWLQTGVLDELLRRAKHHGYEAWITADHGNLECLPTKEPQEGAFVERAGTRVRRYASRTLRDQARADGLQWDDLPGYPAAEAERLLFAPGRSGWGPSKVSHGGLSLDEVIVPFVHVESTL